MTISENESYLFDTGIWIKLRRGDAQVRKFVFNARFRGLSVGYSILTEAELWAGISEHKFRSEKAHIIMLRPFKRYFINVTISRRAGELKRLLWEEGNIPHKQRPHLDDCLIMATAEYHDLVLYTTDKSDFSKFTDFDLVDTEIRFL